MHLVNVTILLVWFIVILIFHPKPIVQAGGSSLQQPAHDFLQSAKPLDGFSGTTAGMTVQPSQASSNYLHYTESAITVPISNHYSNANALVMGPLPPPLVGDIKAEQLSPLSTPSTATLVSHRYSNRRSGKEQSMSDSGVEYAPPLAADIHNTRKSGHITVALSDEVHRHAASRNDASVYMENAEGANIRRQNSNDSMWLQQTPRGSNR